MILDYLLFYFYYYYYYYYIYYFYFYLLFVKIHKKDEGMLNVHTNNLVRIGKASHTREDTENIVINRVDAYHTRHTG